MIGQVGASRPQYYDRNPVQVTQYYAANVGPHASTTRWTYTVTAAKKSYLQRGLVSNLRLAAAGAVDQVFTRLNYTPSGGVLVTIAEATAFNNTVGTQNRGETAGVGLMGAGDVIVGVTSDAGTTTSSHQFIASLWAVEFDA